MAGSISLSGSQQLDNEGVPLSGGLLYFFAAGTTTPQNAFQDTSLTIPFSNPIVLGADGRVPFFYLADGAIKIRLTDSTGVTVVAADNILVIGPSTGGVGGGSVDPTTVYQTGDVKYRYGTGTHSGWVRANGRTIGSAASGATERANADCQALFEYIWTNDAFATVSGGRGASANADWTANKTITLPDWRGRVLAGMGDMGTSNANRLTSTYFGGDATVLGTAGGAESHALTEAQMPTHTHSVTDPGHTHALANGGSVVSGTTPDAGAGGSAAGTLTSIASATTGISLGNTGSGSAHNNVQPTSVVHIYVKL